MGSYLYEYENASPLADLIKTPTFMQPTVDILYTPVRVFAEILGRPED